MKKWYSSALHFFYWLPSLLISMTAASVLYIGTSLLVQVFTDQNFESKPLYVVFVALMWLWIRKYVRTSWSITDLEPHWTTPLLVLAPLTLILYRAPIYFHALDDFVFHMVAGFYFGEMVNGDTFLPMDFGGYLYPLLQIPYYFLIDTFGIRLTLFSLSSLQLVWLLHLALRFSHLIFPKNPEKRPFIDLLFLGIYFLPELSLTHVTFMSDFYTVLFALEALYSFLKKSPSVWMFIFMTLALFTKQSSGIFLIPLFIYMWIARGREIRVKEYYVTFLFLVPIALYAAINYELTGNPLAFLLNGVFQSPLYAAESFRDLRWGPTGLISLFLWPLQGLLTDRYIEFTDGMKLRPFFSLFLSVPYVLSWYLLLRKRRAIDLAIVGSYLFWAWYSGYGRYHIAMSSIIIMFLALQFSKNIPHFSYSWRKAALALLFAAVCFTSVKNDYALRGFILQSSIRTPIAPYPLELYKAGLRLIGKDRYLDIYESVKVFYPSYEGVVVQGRGVSTFYAFLANKFAHKPVIRSEDNETKESILKSDKVSENLKKNIKDVHAKRSVLFFYDQGSVQEEKQLKLPDGFSCGAMCRSKLAPQFHHGNYFNLVQEYSCYKG